MVPNMCRKMCYVLGKKCKYNNIIGKYKGKTLLSIKGMDDLKKRLLIVKTFYFKTYHLE